MQQLTKRFVHALVALLAIGAGAAMATDTPVKPEAKAPIKIGVQAPLSGGSALEGLGIVRSVKLLARQQNAKGGLLGHHIDVIVCDDQNDPPQAALCARTLVMAGVTAVVGTYSGDSSLVAGPIYAAADVIQTTGSSSDVLATKGWTTFFRNAPSNTSEADFVANYLVNIRQFRRIALLDDHSRESRALAQGIANAIKNQQGSVIASAEVISGSRDFTRVLKGLKAKLPDAIFYSGSFADGGLIREEMVRLGMPAVFVGSTANWNPSFANLASGTAKGSIIIVNMPTPDTLPSPAARKFQDDYTAMYGSAPPDIYALTNADGLRAVFAAMEATKSTDTAKLVAWLHGLKQPFDGLTGPIMWDKQGNRVSSPMAAFQLQANGAYTKVYPDN